MNDDSKEKTIKDILQLGDLKLQGRFLLGSNYTFLVNACFDDLIIQAVYKPARGENLLWDFPEYSLTKREVASHLVSEALGWHFVPYTIEREGPFGLGSLQQFIDYDPNYHYFTFNPTDRLRLRPAVLFDLLINNADRKGSHVIIQKQTHHLYFIDHGLCFHVEDKLRSVIWDFAGEPFSEGLISTLSAFHNRLLSDTDLIASLALYLSPDEIEALTLRTARLIACPTYPYPPEDRRAFPYPPL